MKITGKKRTWLQTLFWGSVWLVLPVLLSGGDFTFTTRWAVQTAVVLAGVAITVIINMEILLPRLYLEKKQALYFLSGLGLVVLLVLLVDWEMMPWSAYYNRPQEAGRGMARRGGHSFGGMRYLSLALPYLMALIGSAISEVLVFASEKEKESVQLRNEKLNAELQFLKTQINPHFLFNTLNNIYSLTVLKSDEAPENLLKLADMLRYMLYDCKAERVPLQKEVAYLKNYIGLVRLKDSSGLNVTAQLDESHPRLMVAPLLFVPFIENAFKHSKVEDLEKGWVAIKLEAADTAIHLEVANSRPPNGFTKDKAGGIGLANVQRQLELTYPGKHELKIETTSEKFQINLKIDLT